MLHIRLGRPTHGVETEYLESPGALPEVRRRTSLTSTPAEDRRLSLCQSDVLPYHQTIEEALQEEPWTIRSNCHPWFTLVHSSPAPAFLLRPPHLPHIPVRTGGTGPIPTMRPTPPTPSRDRRRHRIRNKQESLLQV